MKPLSWIAAGALISCLAACSANTPPDQFTEEAIHPYAEQNLLLGMYVVDFKHDSGWADKDYPNLYTVKYTFNYQLAEPVDNVILANAKLIANQIDGIKHTGTMPPFASNLELASIQKGVDLWIAQQGQERIDARTTTLLERCKPCDAFWHAEQGGKQAVEHRHLSLLAALSMIEQLGFSLASKTGDKVPRWAQAGFTKTDEGWQTLD